MRKATAPVLGLLALAAAAPEARAQTALPRPFVFFVEGVNPAIPTVDGPTPVTDPSGGTNRVLAFTGGNYSNPAFRWPAATGVSLEPTRAGRDSVFMRLRIGPGAGTPAAHANLMFQLLDSESLNNNGMSDDDDIAFRAQWQVPDSLFDDRWHTLKFPLPPVGRAALAAALRDSTVDGQPLPADQRLGTLGKAWKYPGGYNPDGFAWIPDSNDGRFREFDFTKVQNIGFFWDQGSGPAGTVYVDNLYFGRSNTDLSSYQGGGTAYNGTVTAQVGANSRVNLSFTPMSGASGYRVYVVNAAGADVTNAANALLVRSFTSADASLALSYPVFSPHPSIPNPSVTFAVTAVSASGVENTTPVYTTVTVPGAKPQGYVFALTPQQMDRLYTAFETRTFSTTIADLSKVTPFRISPTDGTIEKPEQVTTAADLDVKTWIGYGPSLDDPNETVMMVYADITDDVRVFNADNGSGAPVSGQFYTYDELAVFFGTYRVTAPIGSTNTGMVGGQDYGFNLAPLTNAAGQPSTVWPAAAASTLFSAPLLRIKANGTGYEMLAAFLLSDLAPDAGPAVTFTPPAPTEIAYHPLTIAYDEQDGAGETFDNRSGTVGSVKPNVNFANPGWYASPRQWPAVAFAGSAVANAVETTEGVATFALDGSRPNPSRGRTAITFATETAGAVKLEVFDVLGRRVATVVDGVLPAGAHRATFEATGLASGTYVYRLSAGDRVATRTMVVAR